MNDQQNASLADLKLETEYRSIGDEPIDQFYRRCLTNASSYKRAVGYFRSTIFYIVGDDFLQFAERGGKFQIICSPSLTEEDARSIVSGYSVRDEVMSRAIVHEIDRLLAHYATNLATRILATLIAKGVLEIKLAELAHKTGIYHEKLGVFEDSTGNMVTFRGSTNETWSGWHPHGNFETIEVFCSWAGESDCARTRKHKEHFDALWNNLTPSVNVYSFPKSIVEYCKKHAFSSIEEIREEAKMSPLLKRSPLPHQIRAIASWKKQGCRGILEHATGTGKTFTAVQIILEHVQQGRPALVLVPSRLLLHQWAKEISQEVPEATIMLAGDGYSHWKNSNRLKIMTTDDAQLGPRITIALMATASTEKFINEISGGDHLLIVADEVHQVGSTGNSRSLHIASGPRLGLSATPKRYGDPIGTAVLKEYFGPIVPPPITLADAMKAGRLVPYTYFPHPVTLNASETDLWREMTNRIRREVARSGTDQSGKKILSEKARLLLIQRSRIAKKARAKVDLAVRIIKQNYKEGQSWLVYCEDSEQLRDVMASIQEAGIEAIEFHSNMEGDRDGTMDWFDKFGGVLVSIKCLDEGIDIPKVSHALILASSQNPRQFIQRRGRVLRLFPGKHSAEIHDAIVKPIDPEADHDQMGMLKGELIRAIEFSNSAMNKSGAGELRAIAIDMGIDLNDIAATEGDESDG